MPFQKKFNWNLLKTMKIIFFQLLLWNWNFQFTSNYLKSLIYWAVVTNCRYVTLKCNIPRNVNNDSQCLIRLNETIILWQADAYRTNIRVEVCVFCSKAKHSAFPISKDVIRLTWKEKCIAILFHSQIAIREHSFYKIDLRLKLWAKSATKLC